MSRNVEIESKGELKESEYLYLYNKYKDNDFYLQINNYIDDDNLIIRQKKCGLRIREIKGRYELTLKVSLEVGKLEINQDIDEEIFAKYIDFNIFPDGEVKEYLINLGVDISKLHILGSLSTYRLDIKYKSSLISIDKSLYNGIIDYEIECEDKDEEISKNNIVSFLKENDIEYKKSKANKLKRFLATLP